LTQTFVQAVALLFIATVPAVAAPPTFHKEVARIVHRHCANCHREGEIGPFPLLTYDQVRPRAKLIAEVVAARAMPPWKPDPGHGEFLDSRRLTDEQVATLVAWTEAGAPEGDRRDASLPPQFKTGWQLGEPDLILKMPEAFVVPAEGRDIYMHFVFPLPIKEETYLRGIECRPGNRRVAHHAVGILDGGGTARKLDAKHPGPGYPGNGPGFIPAGFTPGYAPGTTPRFFHPDTAIALKPGTDFVLQMHYHPIGKEERDQTEIGLYFTKKKPPKGIVIIAMGSEEIDIPAGEKAYRCTDRFTLPVELEIRDIWAHMHMIGKSVRVTATLPDGSTRSLLRISDWDFNWQDGYLYQTPFKLPKGTVIDAEWTWDNSAANPRNPFQPPQRIAHGEGSTDEMSGLIIGGVANHWLDEIGHWAAAIGHYFEVAGKGAAFKAKAK
jgi:mono/diheme cytochrome c family protein